MAVVTSDLAACPECGGAKSARAAMCRDCFESDGVTRPTRDRLGEYRFLLDCGVGIAEALARVGWSPQGACRWFYRHGDPAMGAAIDRAAKAAGTWAAAASVARARADVRAWAA